MAEKRQAPGHSHHSDVNQVSAAGFQFVFSGETVGFNTVALRSADALVDILSVLVRSAAMLYVSVAFLLTKA